MQIKLDVQGLEKVKKELGALASGQFRNAVARTLNMVGGRVAKNLRAEMESAFDRPTPYTLRSIRTNVATAQQLDVTIAPTYMGGKGIDPQKFLKAQADGGRRRDKRAESAFRKAGILPGGYQLVIPKDPYPGSDDGRGNLRGPFIAQLISYFQAFSEQGYKANMKDKRIKKLANRGRTQDGYKTINGVVYFVSYGRLRGTHLAPGIWAKSGIHGSNVKPVAMFTRAGTYQRRLDLEKVVQQTDVSGLFNKWLRGNLRDEYRAIQSNGMGD